MSPKSMLWRICFKRLISALMWADGMSRMFGNSMACFKTVTSTTPWVSGIPAQQLLIKIYPILTWDMIEGVNSSFSGDVTGWQLTLCTTIKSMFYYLIYYAPNVVDGGLEKWRTWPKHLVGLILAPI
jgi:hypothetical protein